MVHDPIANFEEAQSWCDVQLNSWECLKDAQVLVICVAHDQYLELTPVDFLNNFNNLKLIIDVKGILDLNLFEKHRLKVWRL